MTETREDEQAGRARLSRTAVVDRAVALADAEGLDAVTIRRLAQELGVTPMALYWHFRNKNELLVGLFDHTLESVDLTVEDGTPWSEQLAVLLRSAVGALREHPWIPRLLALADCRSDRYLDLVEVLLAILQRGGFPPERASAYAMQMLRMVTAMVTAERGLVPTPEGVEVHEGQRRSRAYLEMLPAERYPHVVAAAGPLSSCEPGGGEDLGVEVLLAGIRAVAPGSANGVNETGGPGG